MSMNAEYVAKMKAQLKQWDTDVDALAARGEKASSEARAAYRARISDLRVGREAARKTLEDIRFASETAGSKLYAGMDAAWKTMQESLDKVAIEFRR